MFQPTFAMEPPRIMKFERAAADLASNPRRRLKRGMNNPPPPTPPALHKDAPTAPNTTASTSLQLNSSLGQCRSSPPPSKENTRIAMASKERRTPNSPPPSPVTLSLRPGASGEAKATTLAPMSNTPTTSVHPWMRAAAILISSTSNKIPTSLDDFTRLALQYTIHTSVLVAASQGLISPGIQWVPFIKK